MQLSYEGGFAVPQYNGKWFSRGGRVAHAYGYIYERVSCLIGADYVVQQAESGQWCAEQQRYGLHLVCYDENGNILVSLNKSAGRLRWKKRQLKLAGVV